MAAQVSVVGGGSFGSVMTRIVAHAVSMNGATGGCRFAPGVRWWVRRAAQRDEINERGTNAAYLGSAAARFPPNVVADTELRDVVHGADVIVLAVPHEFLAAGLAEMREVLASNGTAVPPSQQPPLRVVSVVKGFGATGGGGGGGSNGTEALEPLSAMIQRSLSVAGGRPVRISSLMGPNIYREMAPPEGQLAFAEATLGCPADEFAVEGVHGAGAGAGAAESGAALLEALFSTDEFGVEVVRGTAAVELMGALKNCYTLGCGFTEGLGLGANARAAVIRHASHEIPRLCLTLFGPGGGGGGGGGGNGEVAAGFVNAAEVRAAAGAACGIGDLVLSCTVGRGQQLAAAFARQRMAAEDGAARRSAEAWGDVWTVLEQDVLGGHRIPDVHNLASVHAAAVAAGVVAEYPLLRATYQIAFCGAHPRVILNALRSKEQRCAS